MRYSSLGVVAVAVASVIAVPLFAQESCDPTGGSAALVGTVREAAADVALPGTAVTATWTGGRSEAVTGAGGRFVLCDLPAEEALRVRAEAAGFESEVVELRLTPGETWELQLLVSVAAREPEAGAAAEDTARERTGRRGRVVGRVLDAETGEPVEGVLLAWGSDAYEETTSSDGAFVLDRVPAGERTLRVRHIAYGERAAAVAVPANATVEVELRLAAEPIELEPLTVTVTEVRDRRLEIKGFYERKEWGERLGRGHFFTREDIERRNPHMITHMVADVPGVRLECSRSYRSRTCDPVSIRAARLSCVRMNVYLDGIRVLKGGRGEVRWLNDPELAAMEMRLDEMVNPTEIAAVEVYTSSAELPGEFGGATGQCGAVVIWTRRAR